MLEEDDFYKKVYNIKNLKFSFLYLQTASNIDYKNYYRALLNSYNMKLEENLSLLSQLLKNRDYKPKDILRFYMPKKTTSTRPITFLHLDDLIVYQSMANVLKKDFIKKRKKYEGVYLFSNILSYNSDFFFEKWKRSYNNFKKKISEYLENGFNWVLNFDLASYYNTISHDTLIEKSCAPRYANFRNLLSDCLKSWSSHKTAKNTQGIPQGPIASNFFAEIYLFSLDEALVKNNINFVRYVDDIKIFGKSKKEVEIASHYLETLCHEFCLIPQSSKCEIKQIEKIEELTKFLSFSPEEETKLLGLSDKKIYEKFSKSSEQVQNYILKNIGQNSNILNFVLENLIKSPGKNYEFISFLENYYFDSFVVNKISEWLLSRVITNPYLEGKLWVFLSKCENSSELKSLKNLAYQLLKKQSQTYSLKYGVYRYLCSLDNSKIKEWLVYEKSALIQMMIIPYITNLDSDEGFIQKIFNRSDYEPGVVLYNEYFLLSKETILKSIEIKPKNNLLNHYLDKEIFIDSIHQKLQTLYSTKNYTWETLFTDKQDYDRANIYLYASNNVFKSDSSKWLLYINSFNDLICFHFLKLLMNKNPNIKWPKCVNQKQYKVKFGSILENTNQFCKKYPTITDIFRDVNNRRNSLPESHPIDTTTLKKTEFLNFKEKDKLYKKLKKAYKLLVEELIKLT